MRIMPLAKKTKCPAPRMQKVSKTEREQRGVADESTQVSLQKAAAVNLKVKGVCAMRPEVVRKASQHLKKKAIKEPVDKIVAAARQKEEKHLYFGLSSSESTKNIETSYFQNGGNADSQTSLRQPCVAEFLVASSEKAKQMM